LLQNKYYFSFIRKKHAILYNVKKHNNENMYSKINSASVVGINAFTIEIETHLDNQLPMFTVVGLPTQQLKNHAKELQQQSKIRI